MNTDINRSIKDKFLVFLMLFLSGDPAFYKQDWASVGLVAVGFALLFYYRTRLKANFYKSFMIYASVFLLVFLYQYYNLGSLAVSYTLGFVVKMFIGAVIFTVLKERFSPVFFDVIYWVCLVSLPFYLIHILFGDNALSNFYLNDGAHSVGLYTFRPRTPDENYLRNSGMFWEPGAFQDYINLALFFNFRRLPNLLKNRKGKLLVIFVTFITTQSTTGFLLFALLVLAYIFVYTSMNKVVAIIIAIFFFTIGGFLFNSLDFLGKKVQGQFQETKEIGAEGTTNTTRFGALLFDWHYIKKNPLTGNGFDPRTRFADDPEIADMIERGKNPGFGNGFSDFVASAGILGMFWYLCSIYKNIGKFSKSDAWLLIAILVVSFQSEVFLRFPFFLGLPFLIYYVPSKHIQCKRAPKVSYTNNVS